MFECLGGWVVGSSRRLPLVVASLALVDDSSPHLPLVVPFASIPFVAHRALSFALARLIPPLSRSSIAVVIPIDLLVVVLEIIDQ